MVADSKKPDTDMSPAARAYLAEFIGTFALVLVGTAVATLSGFVPGWQQSAYLGISFAFGFTLMVLVWTIGPVSGCHVNPAVSIPMALSGRLSWSRLPGYLIAQFAGGIAASALLLALLKGMEGSVVYIPAEHGLGANGNPLGMTIFSLFMWEVVLTALFLLVIFTATRSGSVPGFEGLAIGTFLFVAHLIGAQLGDSSLNPARSFGPALFVGGEALRIIWVFLIAPVLGGIVGWRLYQLLHNE